MSIGLNRSFQYSGLNRCGLYMQTAKEKGPERADRSVAATEKPNELWRRYTGIFPGVTLDPWQRKRGLRILATRIRERVQRKLSEPRASASGPGALWLVADWDIEAESWARAEAFGISVEGLCAELGCSRHTLTALMKEHCGVSAGEFLDGLKISRLRARLVERLREAASELWGSPGSFALVKLGAAFDSTQRHEDAKARRGERTGTGERVKGRRRKKCSRYFRSRVEEMFEETPSEERARRVDELCEMLRGGTGGRATSGTLGTRGTRFELESWAISCGYESGAKLKRACLNVFGRTLAQVERVLAAEVVQFYLCAEDRELRAIACSNRLSVEVARAREVYHGDEAMPEPPFVDEWAKFEELKAEWLARMGDAFG